MPRIVDPLPFSLRASMATHLALFAVAATVSTAPVASVSFRGKSSSQPLTLQAEWLPERPQYEPPSETFSATVAMAAPVTTAEPLAAETTVSRRAAERPLDAPLADLDRSTAMQSTPLAPQRRATTPTQPQVRPADPIERQTKPCPQPKAPPQVTVAPPEAIGVDDKTPPNFSVTRAPTYPLAAQQRGHQGDVVVRLHVARNGRVEKAEVVESSGHAALDQAAVEAVSVWRGRPAMQNGQAVATTVRLRFQFRIPR